MRIEFEANFLNPFRWVAQTTKELICRLKGHDWVKVEEDNSLFSRMHSLYGFRSPEKSCSRCGDVVYKKRDSESKPISWTRYAPVTTKPKRKHAKTTKTKTS